MKRCILLAILLPAALAAGSLTSADSLPSVRAQDAGSVAPPGGDNGAAAYASLSKHCQKMLEMQTAVQEATNALDKAVQGRPDKKPGPKEQARAEKLSAQQKAIVAEAKAAIRVCEAAEGGDLFVEVFEWLRADMESVNRRLRRGDVGTDTRAEQAAILDTLRETILSLRPL
jgi:hypothetical protein